MTPELSSEGGLEMRSLRRGLHDSVGAVCRSRRVGPVGLQRTRQGQWSDTLSHRQAEPSGHRKEFQSYSECEGSH